MASAGTSRKPCVRADRREEAAAGGALARTHPSDRGEGFAQARPSLHQLARRLPRVITPWPVVLDDLPERPDEDAAGNENAEHLPFVDDEQQHQRRADEEQRGDREKNLQRLVAAFRKTGLERDRAFRRVHEPRMQRAHEIAVERRAVLVDEAVRAGVGQRDRPPVAERDAAEVDHLLAGGRRRQRHRNDVGPQAALVAAFALPGEAGVAARVGARHADIRVAPVEVLAVEHKVQVVGFRGGRGRIHAAEPSGGRRPSKSCFTPENTP